LVLEQWLTSTESSTRVFLWCFERIKNAIVRLTVTLQSMIFVIFLFNIIKLISGHTGWIDYNSIRYNIIVTCSEWLTYSMYYYLTDQVNWKNINRFHFMNESIAASDSASVTKWKCVLFIFLKSISYKLVLITNWNVFSSGESRNTKALLSGSVAGD